MADPEAQFAGVLDSLFGGTLQIVFWVIFGAIFIGVAALITWYFFVYRRKFDIKVKISSKRSGENRILFDKGAILRDKKNSTDYLKLLKTKFQLELPKFNIMSHTNEGDYLELIRESERGFRFLTPPEIDSKYLVRHDGKLYPFAKVKQYQIENDITWILERLKANKTIISPESIFMKILEYTPQILSMAFSFIIIWIVFRYAPELLNSMKQLIVESRTQPVEVVGGLIYLLWKKKI